MILYNKIAVSHHHLQHPEQELAAGPCHGVLVNIALLNLDPLHLHQHAGIYVKCCVDQYLPT